MMVTNIQKFVIPLPREELVLLFSNFCRIKFGHELKLNVGSVPESSLCLFLHLLIIPILGNKLAGGFHTLQAAYHYKVSLDYFP